MENLPSPSNIVRRRSLSPALLMKASQGSTQHANNSSSPSPRRLLASNHRRGRSSPLASRPLGPVDHNAGTPPMTPSSKSVGNEEAEDSKGGLSPGGYLRYTNLMFGPQLPPAARYYGMSPCPHLRTGTEKEKKRNQGSTKQHSPSEKGSAESTADSTASPCSAPSSPFMELIYSASASTTSTPEIFRLADEENKATPLIRNCAVRAERTAVPSPSSTLQSTTPQNQQQPQPQKSQWWVPRISTGGGNFALTTAGSSLSSPFSLPSMLGEQSSTEDVSELESPNMLFLPDFGGGEESDIQSQSQATDIYSLKTMSPKVAPLVRCDAQDEEDATGEAQGNPPASQDKAETPTLTQLASGSALCVSREEIVAASNGREEYDDYADSEHSESNKSQQPPEPHLPKEELEGEAMIPEPTVRAQQSYANNRAMRLFFRSSVPTPSPKYGDVSSTRSLPPDPYADLFLHSANQVDAISISELSASQLASSRAGDVESDHCAPHGNQADELRASIGGGSLETKERRCFFAGTSWGLCLRLTIIFILALAVVIPLVVVLIYTRMAAGRVIGTEESLPMPAFTPIPTQLPTMSPTESTPAPTRTTSATIPTKEPVQTASPTIAPVWSFAPTAKGGWSLTAAPASRPYTAAPTTSPTDAVGTGTPTVASPTLPPYDEIWDEAAWSNATFQMGPVWPHSSTPLQLTILNSLSDPDDQAVLEGTVQDWQGSSSVVLSLAADALPISNATTDCVPTLGMIRVCNGNYGDTSNSKVMSQIYTRDLETLAAVILVNDDFGLQSLASSASLKYYLCHELGHSLGVFHSLSGGCMVDSFDLASFTQSDYLRPRLADLEELDRLYGNRRRRHQLRGR